MTLSVVPAARWYSNFAEFPGTGLVLFGGRTNTNSTPAGYLNDTWIWTNNSWLNSASSGTPKGPSGTFGPPARSESVMFYDGTTMVLSGGTNETTWVNDTWEFSSSQGWTNQNTQYSLTTSSNYEAPVQGLINPPYNALNSTRGAACGYVSGSTTSYVIGGRNAFYRHYALDQWNWTHTGSWSFNATTNNPTSKAYGAMAGSSTQLLYFGGINFAGYNAETWLFTPSTNVWVNLTSNYTPGYSCPSARQGASLIYDQAISKFVLFGGQDANGYKQDTWTFDPVALRWNNPNPSNSPSPRAFHCHAYNSSTSTSVMFSGLGYSFALLDTWVYNAASNSWTQQ
jgi:hypothetical protein